MPKHKKRKEPTKELPTAFLPDTPSWPTTEGTPAPRAPPAPAPRSGAPILVRTAGGRSATVIERKQRGWFVCDLDGDANDEGKANERKTIRRPHGFAPGQDHLLDAAPQAVFVPKPKKEGGAEKPKKKKAKSQAGPGPVPVGAVRARTAGGRVATVLYRKQRGWFAVEMDGDADDEGGAFERKTLRRPMFAPGQDELLNTAPPDPNPEPPKSPKKKDDAASKDAAPAAKPAAKPRSKAPKAPAPKKAAPAPKKAAADPTKEEFRAYQASKKSPQRPLTTGVSGGRPGTVPADTPVGLSMCFNAFFPGSSLEIKQKFARFVTDNTLCPAHVLRMPEHKCEAMLQQHGFEGVVVFTFQSRLRDVCVPTSA
jgi:hypothetical protein